MNRRQLVATAAALGLGFSLAPALAAGLGAYDAGSFSKAVAAGPVVVHVHAAWCPVCRKQQPALEQLAKEPTMSKVRFVTVNFDKDKDFLKANKIANQSVIVVFKGGKEVARLAGITDAGQIRARIAKAL